MKCNCKRNLTPLFFKKKLLSSAVHPRSSEAMSLEKNLKQMKKISLWPSCVAASKHQCRNWGDGGGGGGGGGGSVSPQYLACHVKLFKPGVADSAHRLLLQYYIGSFCNYHYDGLQQAVFIKELLICLSQTA